MFLKLDAIDAMALPLPFEIIEMISTFCDCLTYQRIRATCKSYHRLSHSNFDEYHRLLFKLKLEKWHLGNDTEEWEHGFWFAEKYHNEGDRVFAFQKRVHLELDIRVWNQKHFLYVCRNALAFEVCRIATFALDNHISTVQELTVSNAGSTISSCPFSLGFAIIADDSALFSRLLYLDGVDPSIGRNLPIRLAAKLGRNIILNRLLQDTRVDPSAFHNAAFVVASLSGKVESIQILLMDQRVNPADNENRAIIGAASFGHVATVQLLLQDPRVDPSAGRNMAIIGACSNGQVDVARLLLQDARVDPADQDNEAIITASALGHTDIVQLLLQDSRVDPAFPNNRAVKEALENKNWDIVDLLRGT